MLVVAAVLLAVMWLSWDVLRAIAAHREARATWEAKEPAAYSFDYRYCSGMCAGCVVHVTVEDGEVANAVGRGQCTRSDTAEAPTIAEVLDMASATRFSYRSEVRYDAVWGYPASVSIECGEDTSDCGTGYGVSAFRLVSRAAAAAGTR